MKKIIDYITEETRKAFRAAGYDEKYAKVSISNRPDLCEYQCNGAMAAQGSTKRRRSRSPRIVAAHLQDSRFSRRRRPSCPGFINLTLTRTSWRAILGRWQRIGAFREKRRKPETIVIDYGGPNVAKPLHVGHLRSAIIGESIKRICRFMGYKVIGDVHLGDWGLQMGLIITELQERKPELPYFDEGLHRGISGGSALYHQRAGGDLSDGQCKVQGGRGLQGGGAPGDRTSCRRAAADTGPSGTIS